MTTPERFSTNWGRVDRDYYLCMIRHPNGLRYNVWVGAYGEIKLTTLRKAETDPVEAAMLAQVLAEAPVQIAELNTPMATPSTRPGNRKTDKSVRIGTPKRSQSPRGIPAKYPGVCLATGVMYQAGAMITYMDPIGWILVDPDDSEPCPF